MCSDVINKILISSMFRECFILTYECAYMQWSVNSEFLSCLKKCQNVLLTSNNLCIAEILDYNVSPSIVFSFVHNLIITNYRVVNSICIALFIWVSNV